MVDGWMAGRKEEGGGRRNNHLGAFHVCGVCLRVCVQLCAGVKMCMCACMWRPEVCVCFLQELSTSFTEAGSLTWTANLPIWLV